MLKKTILILTGLAMAVLARENPFLPTKSFEGLDKPTNIVEKKEDFDQQSTSLPSRARVLKYVIFGYQSLDGSTEEKRMEVDKDIDWHDPLVLTKESNILNPPIVLPKLPFDEEMTPELSADKKEKIVKNNIPTKAKEESVKVEYEKLINFEAFKMKIKVNTNDELLRNFMVVNPYKIVLDFKNNTSFYTKELSIEHGAFKQITLGNHKGYYRAAILLDGHYLYDVREFEGGYEIVLK